MLHVQIVSGLVQQQNVRLLQQQLAQQYLGALPAAQIRHVLFQADLIQTQGPGHFLHLGVDHVEVVGHQQVLYGAQLLHHDVHLVLIRLTHAVADLVHLLLHLKQEGEGAL